MIFSKKKTKWTGSNRNHDKMASKKSKENNSNKYTCVLKNDTTRIIFIVAILWVSQSI